MVTEIIDSIANEASITTSLLKTLAFAHRIGNVELINWASRELNGYEDGVLLPRYRSTKTIVQADIRVGGVIKTQPLPYSCIDEEFGKHLMRNEFYDSISAIEDIAKQSSDKVLGKELPAEVYLELNRQVLAHGCKFAIVGLRQLVSVSEVSAIMTSVKTKLMELLLQIESGHPHALSAKTDEEEKNNVNAQVTNYIMTNIYKIVGDGGVLNNGNDNQITINNTITKGNIDELVKHFQSSGVPSSDIEEIKDIALTEEPSGNELGLQSKTWISKMLSKAADGSWKIGIATAAALLEYSLKKYFGLDK